MNLTVYISSSIIQDKYVGIGITIYNTDGKPEDLPLRMLSESVLFNKKISKSDADILALNRAINELDIICRKEYEQNQVIENIKIFSNNKEMTEQLLPDVECPNTLVLLKYIDNNTIEKKGGALAAKLLSERAARRLRSEKIKGLVD